MALADRAACWVDESRDAGDLKQAAGPAQAPWRAAMQAVSRGAACGPARAGGRFDVWRCPEHGHTQVWPSSRPGGGLAVVHPYRFPGFSPPRAARRRSPTPQGSQQRRKAGHGQQRLPPTVTTAAADGAGLAAAVWPPKRPDPEFCSRLQPGQVAEAGVCGRVAQPRPDRAAATTAASPLLPAPPQQCPQWPPWLPSTSLRAPVPASPN